MAIKQLESPLFKARYAAGATSGTPGSSLANGKIWVTKEGGTYSTAADRATVWTDKVKTAQITRNADGSISLDAAGEKEIWFDEIVDIRVESSTDELQYTLDYVSPLPATTDSTESNMVKNGSFETDADSDTLPDDWTIGEETGATIALTTTAANVSHGTQSLEFAATGSGGGTALSAKFPVDPTGKKVRVFGSLKQSGAATGKYRFILYWYKPDGTASSTVTTVVWEKNTGAPTAFTQFSGGAAVPSDATQAAILIEGIGAAGTDLTGTCWFDNIIVRQAGSEFVQMSNDTLTTGSTHSWTDIPNWANKITFRYAGVSTTSTNVPYVRLRSGGTVDSLSGMELTFTGTGTPTVAMATYLTNEGVKLTGNNVAANSRDGVVVFERLDDDKWMYEHHGVAQTGTNEFIHNVGDVLVTGAPDEVQLQVTGDTFDAGEVTVSYEG